MADIVILRFRSASRQVRELMAACPAGPQGRGACIQIIDNGRGYDVTQPRRNGLLSMQQRATALGMALRLDSAPGRTVVEITVE